MLANRVRELTSTTGTGDITLAGALPGHIGFSDAFTPGDGVIYVIEDGDNYEIGTGTLVDVMTLARTEVAETLVDGAYAHVGATAINLSGNARVYCAATADFLLSPTHEADVIREVTPDAGVTADGVLLKDGGVFAGAGEFTGDLMVGGQIASNSVLAGFATTGADTGVAIKIASSGVTSANGLVYGAIGWTPSGSSEGSSARAAIAAVQQSNDNDQIGLNFYVHPSQISADPMELALTLNSNKSATFSGSIVSNGSSFIGGVQEGGPQGFAMNFNGWDGLAVVPNAIVGLGVAGGGLRFDVGGSQGEMLLETGKATFTGAGFFAGVLSTNVGAEGLTVKPGSQDHAYMGFYARTATPTTRSGYVGYTSGGTTQMAFVNALNGSQTFWTNGINWLSASSTGAITMNGPVGIGAVPVTRMLEVTEASGSATVAALINVASLSSQIAFKGSTGVNDYDVRAGAVDANVFGIYTNNTLAVSWDPSQNATFASKLGIGVIPIGDFHVQGTTDTRIGGTGNNYYTYFQTNSGTSKGALGALSASFRVQSQSSMPLELFNTQGLGLTIANGTGKLTVDGGAKISVQNKVDGGSGRGIFFWDTDATTDGAYMASSGALKSLSDETAATSLDGRAGLGIRHRITNGATRFFGWENSAEMMLMSLTADTGDLYTKGAIFAGGTDVKMYQAAAGTLGWATEGVGRMFLNATALDMYVNIDMNARNVTGVNILTVDGPATFVADLFVHNLKVDSSGIGALNPAGAVVFGGGTNAGGYGANILCYGEAGASAFDTVFRAGSAPWLYRDHSRSEVTLSDKLVAKSGTMLSVMGGVDGGSDYGLFLWDTGNPYWGITVATAGIGKSLSGGDACASLDGRTSHHVRFRAINGAQQGFIWENHLEEALMSLGGDTGRLYTFGGFETSSSANLGSISTIGLASFGGQIVGAQGIQSRAAVANIGGRVTFMDISGGVNRIGAYDWDAATWGALDINNSAIVVDGITKDAVFSGAIYNTTSGARDDLGNKVAFASSARIIGALNPWFELWHAGASVGRMSYTSSGGFSFDTHTGDGSLSTILRLDRLTKAATHYGQVTIEQPVATMLSFDRTADLNVDSVFNIFVSFDTGPTDDFMSFGTGSNALRVYGDNTVKAMSGLEVTGEIIASSYIKGMADITANRPPAATAGAGASMFDTTLGKPIRSDGSQWVDATGTAV